MTDTQKFQIKSKIQAELERVAADITTLEEITKPVDTKEMDEIARMDAIVSKSVNDAALAASRTRLAALEYALKRIDDPEFGYCMDCGEEIAFARLNAMPETSRCIDCAH